MCRSSRSGGKTTQPRTSFQIGKPAPIYFCIHSIVLDNIYTLAKLIRLIHLRKCFFFKCTILLRLPNTPFRVSFVLQLGLGTGSILSRLLSLLFEFHSVLFTMIAVAILVTVATVLTVIITVAPVAAPVLALALVAVVLAVTVVALVATALEEVTLLHFEDALVGVDQIGDLVGKLHGQGLETRGFRTMQNDGFSWVVQRRHQLLIDDHLADQRVDLALGKLEHFRQIRHTDRGVHIGIGEQVGAQRFLLDELGQHFADAVGFVEQIPHLDVHLLVDDEVGTGVPVSVAHCFGGRNYVLTHGFRGTCELRWKVLLINNYH